MKIEKLNEDKIRITISIIDLEKKNIDFNSFMANSIESQEIFLEMLDEAEKRVGFTTEDYKIMIEALALNNGDFIFTITRIIPDKQKFTKGNLHIKRKNNVINPKKSIYCFNSFNDFCDFCSCLSLKYINYLNSFSEGFSLYMYNNKYFLIISNINRNSPVFSYITSIISEFSTLVDNPNLYENKLFEYGEVIFDNNAIKNCINYFCKGSI